MSDRMDLPIESFAEIDLEAGVRRDRVFIAGREHPTIVTPLPEDRSVPMLRAVAAEDVGPDRPVHVGEDGMVHATTGGEAYVATTDGAIAKGDECVMDHAGRVRKANTPEETNG